MDYTNTNGYVYDPSGRRQLSNRDLSKGISGTDLDCTDLQNVVNSLMYLIENAAGLAGDAKDDTLIAKAVAKLFSASSSINLTTFSAVTSSGGIAIPEWAARVELQCVGGGGGGSSANDPQLNAESAYSGGGGGAGGLAWGVYPVSAGSQLTAIIGAGGGSESNGGNSAVTYNGVTIVAGNGGGGARFGVQGSSAGGTGGAASGGTIANITGGYGSDGQNAQYQLTGNGAAGPWGGSGRAGAGGGRDATSWGAGGGGTYAPLSTTRVPGGSGYQGVVLFRFLP